MQLISDNFCVFDSFFLFVNQGEQDWVELCIVNQNGIEDLIQFVGFVFVQVVIMIIFYGQ